MRRIIQLSPSTHVISLPAQWLRDHALKKGDEVSVEDRDGALVITPPRAHEERALEIDLRGLHDDELWARVDAAYLTGATRMRFLVEEDRGPYFHKVVRYFPGLTISHEQRGAFSVTDIADADAADAEQLISRVHHMVADMVADGLAAHREKRWAVLARIKHRDYATNSYVSYAIRQLMREPRDAREKALLQLLVRQVEELGDTAASLLEKGADADTQRLDELDELVRVVARQWRGDALKELFRLARLEGIDPVLASHAFSLYETHLQLALHGKG